MYDRLKVLAFASIAGLAACGGGGVNGAGYTVPTVPSSAPSTAPQPQNNIPVQDTVAGAAAFVDPANHHTLYFIDGDTPPGTACSGACTSEWPLLTPSANAQAQGNMVMVTRTDGARQWSYQGHALYHFAGDSGPDQANGVYGPWHMARPNASSATGPGGTPCRNYC